MGSIYREAVKETARRVLECVRRDDSDLDDEIRAAGDAFRRDVRGAIATGALDAPEIPVRSKRYGAEPIVALLSRLCDVNAQPRSAEEWLDVKIVPSTTAVDIEVAGYGEDDGLLVFLELVDGDLRVVSYPDLADDEPVIVSLAKAKRTGAK